MILFMITYRLAVRGSMGPGGSFGPSYTCLFSWDEPSLITEDLGDYYLKSVAPKLLQWLDAMKAQEQWGMAPILYWTGTIINGESYYQICPNK